MAKFNDLTGQTFGRLTVIERAENHILPSGKPRTMWLCLCSCGNNTIVSSQSLTQGTTVSCGCQQKENFHKSIHDMTGKRFGKLTVLGYSETKITESGNHKIIWNCQCDCGNVVKVEGYQLRIGKTQSCGCTKSRGEELIAKILNHYKINFIQNKRNNQLRLPTGGYPLFDFQILDEGNLVAVIEMQGVQHYEDETYSIEFGKYEREVTDPFKREFCRQRNIPMYEIKYSDNIESEMNRIIETLHVNTVPNCA